MIYYLVFTYRPCDVIFCKIFRMTHAPKYSHVATTDFGMLAFV